MVKRPLLILGIVIFLFMMLGLPGRIYLVKVSGNSKVPTNQILAEAESVGIQFGSRAKYVRSEEAKNQLLSALPGLQWVGINTSGGVAYVHVQERSLPDKTTGKGNNISSIVAASDGLITKMNVQKGTPLVTVGQAVKKGEVLVSGYTDCGIKIVVQNAQAEIMGYTNRHSTFVTPIPTKCFGALAGSHVCYRLRIGKKVINFCNHSGIPEALCVKMYSEDYLSLPGNFPLPVSIVRIESLYYSEAEQTPNLETVEQWLPAYAQEFVQEQMVAGQILDENLKWHYYEGFCELVGAYTCHEMIGQMKYEEIMEHNAEDN